jgi:hypothetical protein
MPVDVSIAECSFPVNFNINNPDKKSPMPASRLSVTIITMERIQDNLDTR